MILNEAKLDGLLKKSRVDTPERYIKRLEYLNKIKVDSAEVTNNGKLLIVNFDVNGYMLKIGINGIDVYVRQRIKKNTPVSKYSLLLRGALKSAIHSGMLTVDCRCPDFRYRFAYMATKKKYLIGGQELRPAKITNPRNRGGLCKHLIAVLKRPSKWQSRVITELKNSIKDGRLAI